MLWRKKEGIFRLAEVQQVVVFIGSNNNGVVTICPWYGITLIKKEKIFDVYGFFLKSGD